MPKKKEVKKAVKPFKKKGDVFVAKRLLTREECREHGLTKIKGGYTYKKAQ